MRGFEFLLRNYTRVLPVDPNHAGPGERHRCLCAAATYTCFRGTGEFVQRHSANIGRVAVCQCMNEPLETPYTTAALERAVLERACAANGGTGVDGSESASLLPEPTKVEYPREKVPPKRSTSPPPPTRPASPPPPPESESEEEEDEAPQPPRASLTGWMASKKGGPKSTNGTDGNDGNDGNNGANSPSTTAIEKNAKALATLDRSVRTC